MSLIAKKVDLGRTRKSAIINRAQRSIDQISKISFKESFNTELSQFINQSQTGMKIPSTQNICQKIRT